MGLDCLRRTTTWMIPAFKSKRLFPCLVILCLIIVGQYYIIVDRGRFLSYMKDKFYVRIKGLRNATDIQREISGPLHILLISYARTGSSFVGDLLQSHPNAFYFFEPLHFISNKVINDSNKDAARMLHKLFRCRVSTILEFLTWEKAHKGYMKLNRNTRYWKSCTKQNVCYNSTYMDSLCLNHSIIVIKTIRLGLREAAALYASYPDLNLKIVYLIRDPRGTFNSRTKSVVQKWCRTDPKCYDPWKFCAALEDDLNTACNLLATRPEDFIVLRFEDLARDPSYFAKHLITLLGIEWNKEMNNYLTTHTRITGRLVAHKALNGVDYPYTTFRDSSTIATKWRQELPFVRAVRIQRSCRKVLPRMGYHIYETSAVMKSNLYHDESLDDSLLKSCPD